MSSGETMSASLFALEALKEGEVSKRPACLSLAFWKPLTPVQMNNSLEGKIRTHV